MKKIFSILWGICVTILSTVSCTYAYTQEQQEAYLWAYKYNITTQPTIEKAKMNGNLTRQAFAKMVVNYLENVVWINQTSLASCNFPDENKITNNLKPYARKTCTLNIMWTNWKNFNPTNSLSRAQLWTVLSRILWWDKNDTSGKNYYIYHLNKLKEFWIMNKIDNPQTYAKRWDVLIMLKRLYEQFGSNINMNNNKIPTNTNTSSNNKQYLTQEEVQKLIEKEEWLKKGSLDSRWYECSWEECNYEFEYSDNWKKYIYYRDNTALWKIRKVQDLWVNSAENVALKDAKVSRDEVSIEQSFSSNWYIIVIETENNVFVYTMSLDSKIENKKILITKNKALETILKETNLTQYQSNIGKGNKEICSLSYSFFDDKHDMYQCSFSYWWKEYTSYINAKDWTFIPIKKTASAIQYWNSVTWKENVVISEQYSYIDSDEARELLVKKYNIKESGYWIMKKWEGKNAIYVYTVLGSNDNSAEYYIDAINWTKMNSKDDIISTIAKDSGVSKDIIKNSKKSFEESESMNDIVEISYPDIKTDEVVSIYSFNNQWITYTYKVRNIDWKILDSEKESDIWEDKASEIAKQAILNKYTVELKDEYEKYNWSRAYIWYQSSATSDEYFRIPSEPLYVICFTDNTEKNMYRVTIKPNGNVTSIDKISVEEMGFLSAIYYVMWYSMDEINELKDKPLEIWWSLSL